MRSRVMMWAIPMFIALLLAGCGRQAAAPVATSEPMSAATEAPVTPEPAEVDVEGPEFISGSGIVTQMGGFETVTMEQVSRRVSEDTEGVWLLAANVGKGDALVLRVKDYACLIDAGKARAIGRVRRALEAMGAEEKLDAVFLTHTDDDHAGGLDWLTAGDGAPRVAAWYAPAMYTGVKENKHPAAQAAQEAGSEVRWLKRGDEIPLGDTGATLRVLAPASLYEDKDDNNSLVLLLECGQGRMLLAGDMELPEEAELLSHGDDLSCDVLKVPNHGDDDTTSAAFARACGAQIAVISTDSQEKPGTPDPGVVSRLEAAGSRIAATQDSGLGVLVTLSGGIATAEYVEIEAPAPSGLYIAGVDVEDDRIALSNRGEGAVALEGCYLHSDRGDELFVFGEGLTLEPGATLVVGTNSTDGDFDVLWDDKKVLNRKKTDTVYLYDSYGRMLDRMENGL